MAKGGKGTKGGGKGAKGGGKGAKGGGKVKAVREAKEKKIEDATFGMKNKNKSRKVQQKVQHISKQYDNQIKHLDAGQKGKGKGKRDDIMAPVFTTVRKPQVIEEGVDPKSILCQYFKAGQCTRGTRCKFSHDLNVERKAAKIDLFTDQRDVNKETMDDWDEETLRSVVDKKGKSQVVKPTAIVCKYFLTAIESKQYGWFWECPNGSQCQYRHALPPGFEFDKKVEEVAVDHRSRAEVLEEERQAIKEYTPLTKEIFSDWIKDRNKRRDAAAAEARAAAGENLSTPLGGMTGRAIFSAQPSLFQDDEEEGMATITKEAPAPVEDAAPIDESLFAEDEELPDFSSDDEED